MGPCCIESSQLYAVGCTTGVEVTLLGVSVGLAVPGTVHSSASVRVRLCAPSPPVPTERAHSSPGKHGVRACVGVGYWGLDPGPRTAQASVFIGETKG